MKINKCFTMLGLVLGALLLGSCATSRGDWYDQRPDNRPPAEVVREASPYYKMSDDDSFPIYKGPYTVQRPEGVNLFGSGYYELYRTKDATYVTATYFCQNNWYFFHFNSDCAIIDNATGDRYMLRELEYYPTDTCFWFRNEGGKFIRFVMVFPPLPKRVEKVDFLIPGGESRRDFDGSEKRERGLYIRDLRPKNRIPQGRIIR